MNAAEKPSVLILLATGKLGTGISDAFLTTGKYKVYGTSRDAKHPSLVSRGITPIVFQYGSKESISRALQVSKPDVVVIITDLIHIAKSRNEEVRHAKIIMDACIESNKIPHVIFCSTDFCETGPDSAIHVKSKFDMEEYLKTKAAATTQYSILRSCSFFENWDDAINYNPLTRGKLSDLYPAITSVHHIATLDVGKAAVAMADNPNKWAGKILDCVSSTETGDESSRILSQVSGVKCTYQASPPQFILWLILRPLYHMVKYVAGDEYQAMDIQEQIREFRSVVPDAMGAREWFIQKGHWVDGSKFGEEVPVRKPNNISTVMLLSSGLVVAAASVFYARTTAE